LTLEPGAGKRLRHLPYIQTVHNAEVLLLSNVVPMLSKSLWNDQHL
jgi:hypothetical protein